MNRQINLMLAAVFVFSLLIGIFCWGTHSVNIIHANQRAELAQMREVD